MGSMVEINDTLQLTREQGFPEELNLEKHLQEPISATRIGGNVFEFSAKPKIRNYQQAPTRVFLVENRDGKWIYWGLVEVLAVSHDYVAQTTSGTFRVTYVYTPDEMKQAYALIDRRPGYDYFAGAR